jgi:hypothetical protein
MSTHITINGQTYNSIQEMPPDIRRQYETAMQLLAKNAPNLAGARPGDVNISTTTDPGHHAFKTFTTMTSSRIVINGQEYSRWEDVPLTARALFKTAFASAHMSLPPDSKQFGDPKQLMDAKQMADRYQLNYNASSTFTFGLRTLVFMIVIALLIGICVGYKLMH